MRKSPQGTHVKGPRLSKLFTEKNLARAVAAVGRLSSLA